LFRLEAFAEYKNSRSYSQTLLGEIHSIDYYESTRYPDKYLLTFETSYHGETFNKTRLLDTMVFQIEDNEQIANSNCRFKGEFDDEIVAVYVSKDDDKEARIVRAFRCERTSQKIIEIDPANVKYKPSDRMRLKW
jgi:hypothetical protein